ncbi:aldo/keto reductase [Actomonas aquatica]|uniref:Aldo/keto reductase n=1 Tax=Actomonas aquatica TaxID=2866162 RepID=A0ABZ1CFU9_9BACT|nr:aldo/keto reductase [Opitutus sp. WL0086]WRQ90098.1 aldo/keto reductase [Opitutus sp. WL0086]
MSLTFSPICLGTSTFGREIDQTAAFALMDHAAARGITVFDTAALYADGESERIVGAWLASRQTAPGAPAIATKIYPPYTPDAIRSAVTASLERLGRPSVDLLYLHKWDPSVEDTSGLTALHELVVAGTVGALGASNFDAAQLQAALALQHAHQLTPFSVLQNNHNFAVRHVDRPLIDLCAQHGIALVTYSPLGAGFLTGKHRQGVAAGSRFAVSPAHQDIYFNDRALARLDQLDAVAQRHDVPLVRLALAWALHRPGITSVLVGGRHTGHLDQAFAALAFDDPAVWRELDSV